MKYALLMYQTDAHSQPGTPEFQASSQAWAAMGPELQEVLAAGNAPIGLAPVANATTVRVRDGKLLTTDGPFAETHEQLAGAWLFDCPDLDEALKWAARIPTAQYGSVEVRPLWGEE
jgi:hypothetical protein